MGQSAGLGYPVLHNELFGGPGGNRLLQAAQNGAEWWIGHAPQDHVAFWDFDDPAIPHSERDTAANVNASSALLKFSKVAEDATSRSKYRAMAESTIERLVTNYLTPIFSRREACSRNTY